MKKNKAETYKYSVDKIKRKKPSSVSPSPWLEDYEYIYGVQGYPATEGFMQRTAEEYIEFTAKNPEVLRFTTFWIEKKIARETWESWVEKYPVMKRAHGVVCDIIADRRELMAIKFNPTLSTKMQRIYDKNWKQAEDERILLRNKENDENGQKIIVLSELDFKKEKDAS